MNTRYPFALAVMGLLLAAAAALAQEPHAAPASANAEARLLTHVRQLTFAGRRTGEGYFSADGSEMVFQSEREPGNPFYQIYLMNLETGDTRRVSPGVGKTTCSWIAPSGDTVLFASTQDDPDAKKKQDAELAARAAGTQRRYSWDYDEHYDIYACDLKTGRYTNLTHTTGYDAEGSYSPDGRQVVFSSNRLAYTQPMTADERKNFQRDPAYMMDIYIMNADGSNVRRLTTAPGYDGGPFFSPDGRRICWRHFATNGVTAEVWTMNLDGSDKRQLTHMHVMSWAPYYHPSGDYLIFTTNEQGFDNFELYLVDVAGTHKPVRITFTPGFDGLPVFSPDGKKLSWTSTRTQDHKAQIFLADWDDAAARAVLAASPVVATTPAPEAAKPEINFDPAAARRIVTYLASDKLEGRLTGTPGEQLATDFVRRRFREIGLKPDGPDDHYLDPFAFTAGVSLGTGNVLKFEGHDDARYAVDRDWRPLAFSAGGKFGPAPVVFAGYGIVAPARNGDDGYDSYTHLDVKGKWVLALRYAPENAGETERQNLQRYASLRYKAMVARDHGALGLILVSGPNSKVRQQLVPLGFDATLAGTSIPVMSVTDNVAAAWMTAAGRDLKKTQDQLDTGKPAMGFTLTGVRLAADVDIQQVKRTGHNVVAVLRAGEKPAAEAIIVCAHVDHLGKGHNANALDRPNDTDPIHHGADDNASGVAGMLQIAQWMSDQQKTGKLTLKRDVIFAAWSGEEEGLLGSAAFVKTLGAWKAGRHIVACLNMDMIGRLRDNKLTVQGTGSSPVWAGLIERADVPVGLSVVTSSDAYLPTDSTSFYAAGVPAINAFTGAHEDYHRPTDTADKVNYDGLCRVAHFVGLMARGLATTDTKVVYLKTKAPEHRGARDGLRVYLGTIPDYASGDIKGVKLSGVRAGGPADKAGLRGGDVIVKLGAKKIENIYDYTYAIEALKIGQPAEVTVLRHGKPVTTTITPGSRE